MCFPCKIGISLYNTKPWMMMNDDVIKCRLPHDWLKRAHQGPGSKAWSSDFMKYLDCYGKFSRQCEDITYKVWLWDRVSEPKFWMLYLIKRYTTEAWPWTRYITRPLASSLAIVNNFFTLMVGNDARLKTVSCFVSGIFQFKMLSFNTDRCLKNRSSSLMKLRNYTNSKQKSC